MQQQRDEYGLVIVGAKPPAASATPTAKLTRDEYGLVVVGPSSTSSSTPTAAPAAPPTKRSMWEQNTNLLKEEALNVGRGIAGLGRGALGLAEAVLSPIQTLRGGVTGAVENFRGMRSELRQGNLLSAAAKAGGSIPMFGPPALDLGQRTAETGDVAGAVGELAAGPAMLRGFKVAPKAAAATSEAVTPALLKMREMGRDLAPDVKAVALSKLGPAAIGGTAGGLVSGGNPFVAALGAGLGEIVGRRIRRKDIEFTQREKAHVAELKNQLSVEDQFAAFKDAAAKSAAEAMDAAEGAATKSGLTVELQWSKAKSDLARKEAALKEAIAGKEVGAALKAHTEYTEALIARNAAENRLRDAAEGAATKDGLKVAEQKAAADAAQADLVGRAQGADAGRGIRVENQWLAELERRKKAEANEAASAPAPAPQTPPPATLASPAPGFTEMLQERVQAPVTAPKLDALGRTPEQRAYAAATTLAIKEIPWESAKTQLVKQHPGTPIDALEKAFKAAPKRLYETVSAHLRSGLTPTQAVKLLKENGLSVGGESSMLGHMKAELGAIGDKMTPAQRFEYTQLSRTKTAKGMKFKDLKPYEP